jgi:hypothetical protein
VFGALFSFFLAATPLKSESKHPLNKSCIIPIQCAENSAEEISNMMPCTVAEFPCTYLKLPISNKQLRKADLMPWVEKITDKLLGWKAALMNKAGRAALARFVLLAMPIYRLIAINVPKWFIRLVNKIRRGFVWKGRENANGGCCIVAWDKVQWPIDLGDLGIHNLETMGWALQMRWQWLKKTQADRPWVDLELPCHANTMALFAIATTTQVGNGMNTLFWSDPWLHGCSIADLAPLVVACVQPPIRNNEQWHKH